MRSIHDRLANPVKLKRLFENAITPWPLENRVAHFGKSLLAACEIDLMDHLKIEDEHRIDEWNGWSDGRYVASTLVARKLLEFANSDPNPDRSKDAERYTLTPMHALFMTYAVHAWSLHEGIPFMSEPVHATEDGPVLPDLYDAVHWKMMSFVDGPHSLMGNNVEPSEREKSLGKGVELSDAENDLIKRVFDEFGGSLMGYDIRDVVMREDTPCAIAFERGGKGTVIDADLIRECAKPMKEMEQ